jgi:hypothetical protein
MKSVREMVGNTIIAEDNWRRKPIAVAHRTRVIFDDLLGRPGGALLNGRVDRDRCERNAAQFRRRIEFAYLVLLGIR